MDLSRRYFCARGGSRRIGRNEMPTTDGSVAQNTLDPDLGVISGRLFPPMTNADVFTTDCSMIFATRNLIGRDFPRVCGERRRGEELLPTGWPTFNPRSTLGEGRTRRERGFRRECHARRVHHECPRQRAGVRPEASRAILPWVRAGPQRHGQPAEVVLDRRAATGRRGYTRGILRPLEGRSPRDEALDARVIRRWLRPGQHAGAPRHETTPDETPRPRDTITTQTFLDSSDKTAHEPALSTPTIINRRSSRSWTRLSDGSTRTRWRSTPR